MKKNFRAALSFVCLTISMIVFAQNKSVFYQSLEWSHDGKTICFAAIVKDSAQYDKTKWEIYSVNADGGNLKRLTKNNVGDFWCSFSPDDKKIIFQSNRSGNADIYTMNTDGNNVKQLTKDTSNESYPTWQAGGKKIIFTSNRNGNEELYQMNADGSQQKRLTQTPGNELDPSYSPDGKRVVYFYEKGDHHDQVYMANADGTNAINICNDTLNNIYPAWFGDKIIYASTNANDDKTIFLSDMKGNKRELFQNSFFARSSPDGKRLAFIVGQWNDASIYISNADGSNKKLLVKKGDIIKL